MLGSITLLASVLKIMFNHVGKCLTLLVCSLHLSAMSRLPVIRNIEIRKNISSGWEIKAPLFKLAASCSMRLLRFLMVARTEHGLKRG